MKSEYDVKKKIEVLKSNMKKNKVPSDMTRYHNIGWTEALEWVLK